MTRQLIALLIILFVVAYSRASLSPVSYREARTIIRTSLEKFDGPRMLHSKLPIWITDRIVHPQQLAATLFKYLFVIQTNKMVTLPHEFDPLFARFVVLHYRTPVQQQTAPALSIRLWHPQEAYSLPATIDLPNALMPFQCLIIPVGGWRCRASGNGELEVLYLYDILTWVQSRGA